MFDLKTFLQELLSQPGLSGYEEPVRRTIEKTWQSLVDELTVSRVGSLHGLKHGTGKDPRPRILIAAHMDAVGLMVKTITDGMIYFTEIGGFDQRVLPGLIVTVHGKKDLFGVIAQPPDRLLPHEQAGKPVKSAQLMVDVGLETLEVERLVHVGDLISLAQPPAELSGDMVVGHSQDDRASVAAVTVCLHELQHMKHEWDVWAVATTQEEESFAGAYTTPFEIRPQIAVAVDVTFGKENSSDYRTYPLAGGPTIGWGPNVHPALHRRMKALAEKLDVPHNIEIMPRHSGTDAYAMQIVREGIPTLVMGIPLRYMHTAIEVTSLRDIERCGFLMAEFISRLEMDYAENIHWDEKHEQ